jgi:hypothetical protein
MCSRIVYYFFEYVLLYRLLLYIVCCVPLCLLLLTSKQNCAPNELVKNWHCMILFTRNSFVLFVIQWSKITGLGLPLFYTLLFMIRLFECLKREFGGADAFAAEPFSVIHLFGVFWLCIRSFDLLILCCQLFHGMLQIFQYSVYYVEVLLHTF